MFERFYWNDDGTLTDQTIQWANPHSNAAVWDGQSYLYISSFLPFNHKYFDVSVANDKAGTLAVQIWYDNQWVSVVDILDYTSKLTSSGNIVFTIDDEKGWEQEEDSSDITELSTTKIYGAYWSRINLATASASALSINYIGHKFAEDEDLFLKYPMLRNTALMTAFKTGKTDWKDQLILASEFVVADLKSRGLLISKNQILDIKRFKNACCYKAADIIFNGLGGDKWIDYIEKAQARYSEDMNMDNFGIDVNADGAPSRAEKTTRIRRMHR